MTFQEALDVCRKQHGDDFAEGMIRTLVNLGLLKLSDMTPDAEYEMAIRAKEIMDDLNGE